MSFYPVAHTILPRLGSLPQGEFQGKVLKASPRAWEHPSSILSQALFPFPVPRSLLLALVQKPLGN